MTRRDAFALAAFLLAFGLAGLVILAAMPIPAALVITYLGIIAAALLLFYWTVMQEEEANREK